MGARKPAVIGTVVLLAVVVCVWTLFSWNLCRGGEVLFVTGCVELPASREEVERELRFVLPPSASGFRWRDVELAPFDDHTVVSFTVEQSELDTLVGQLPCNPSPTGQMMEWSELGMTSLSPGDLACTRVLNQENWSVVRVSRPEGGRLRISLEQFAGY